jgi:hypothetical protein
MTRGAAAMRVFGDCPRSTRDDESSPTVQPFSQVVILSEAEGSLNISRVLRRRNSQRCFAALNMTGLECAHPPSAPRVDTQSAKAFSQVVILSEAKDL